MIRFIVKEGIKNVLLARRDLVKMVLVYSDCVDVYYDKILITIIPRNNNMRGMGDVISNWLINKEEYTQVNCSDFSFKNAE